MQMVEHMGHTVNDDTDNENWRSKGMVMEGVIEPRAAKSAVESSS